MSFRATPAAWVRTDVGFPANEDVLQNAFIGGVKDRLQCVSIVGTGHGHGFWCAASYLLAECLKIF